MGKQQGRFCFYPSVQLHKEIRGNCSFVLAQSSAPSHHVPHPHLDGGPKSARVLWLQKFSQDYAQIKFDSPFDCAAPQYTEYLLKRASTVKSWSVFSQNWCKMLVRLPSMNRHFQPEQPLSITNTGPVSKKLSRWLKETIPWNAFHFLSCVEFS